MKQGYIYDDLNILINFLIENSFKDEVWRETHLFKNIYFVSSYGRILSLYNPSKPRILKAQMKNNGYMYLKLRKKGQKKAKNIYIHRIVADTFLSNPENKKLVHHKDKNRSNNKVNNLQWATSMENNRKENRKNNAIPKPKNNNNLQKKRR